VPCALKSGFRGLIWFIINRAEALLTSAPSWVINHWNVFRFGEYPMPIYEYECPTCGRFEVIQKISEKPLKQCPQCSEKGKKNPVERAVSASAFHLKGSGWYKTDYSSGNSSSTSTKKSKSTTSESSSSEKSSTTESKPKGGCGSGCGCH